MTMPLSEGSELCSAIPDTVLSGAAVRTRGSGVLRGWENSCVLGLGLSGVLGLGLFGVLGLGPSGVGLGLSGVLGLGLSDVGLGLLGDPGLS